MARILLIDDEELVRVAVSATLRRLCHDVTAAPDGEEGVNLFRQQPFDLVITDVRMPGIDGPEVIKALRDLRSGIPVIIMGGGGSIPSFGHEAFAQQVRADRVLRKPFTMQELNTAVSELLNNARDG